MKNLYDGIEEGFSGQSMIVVPSSILLEVQQSSEGIGLVLTDIGYFPKALKHSIIRTEGAKTHLFIHCVDGMGWVDIAGQEYVLYPHQMAIIPVSVPHSYWSDHKNPWTIYWVHFKGAVSHSIVDMIVKDKGYVFEVNRNENREELFWDIYKTLEFGYSHHNLNYVNMSLYRLLALYAYENQVKSALKRDNLHPVDKAVTFMKDNIDNSLTLRDLATVAGYTPNYFTSLFKEHTGYSPIDYFTHLKIQKACSLLVNTGLKVKQIAFELGYTDPYYFSRTFHKMMHVSPKDYRNRFYMESIR